MDHPFDDPARFARSFDDPSRDAWQMPVRVIEALKIGPGDIVADIGAGTGYFTMRLAQSTAAATVYAVDIEPAMLEHIRQRADEAGLSNVTPVLGGSDRSNLPERVDVVLIVDTFHHIPNRVAYFSALRGLLKPGGRVAIVDFRRDAPDGPPVQFRFTPDEISAQLSEAGFVLDRQHDFLPRQMFLVYRAK